MDTKEMRTANPGEPREKSRSLADADTVDVYDGDRYLGIAPVINGRWSYSIGGLEVGNHQLNARSGTIRSNFWGVAVRADLQLTAPYIPEVFLDSRTGRGNSLNLVKPLSSATVIVSYPGMEVRDAVTMHWRGNGGSTSETKLAGSGGTLSFLVPGQFLTNNINQQVSVSYEVNLKSAVGVLTSPVISFVVTNAQLVGRSEFKDSTTTSDYNCRHPTGLIRLSAHTPPDTDLGSSSVASPSARTAFTVHEASSNFVINSLGAQPAPASSIFPTNIKGIGVKVLRNDGYFNGDPSSLLLPGGYSNGTSDDTVRIEFVAIGVAENGTIPAGEVAIWCVGANRLNFMRVKLTNSVRIELV